MAAKAADAAGDPQRESIPTGSPDLAGPCLEAEAVGWATAELARLGRRVAGPIEQPHVRPWSTALRIPTDRGAAWFKATGPGPAYEGALLELFRRSGCATSCCRSRSTRPGPGSSSTMPGRPCVQHGPTAMAITISASGNGSSPNTPSSSGRSRAHRPERRWWPRAPPTSARIGCPVSWTGCSTTTSPGRGSRPTRAPRPTPPGSACRRPCPPSGHWPVELATAGVAADHPA